MTASYQLLLVRIGKGDKLTIVYRFELRDDIQSHIWKLILEHLKKHWKKM